MRVTREICNIVQLFAYAINRLEFQAGDSEAAQQNAISYSDHIST